MYRSPDQGRRSDSGGLGSGELTEWFRRAASVCRLEPMVGFARLFSWASPSPAMQGDRPAHFCFAIFAIPPIVMYFAAAAVGPAAVPPRQTSVVGYKAEMKPTAPCSPMQPVSRRQVRCKSRHKISAPLPSCVTRDLAPKDEISIFKAARE